MDALVTVAAFTLPSDLVIARGRLESEGIECSLKDELTVQVHNLYSNAVGGVKLQVRVEDAGRARALLLEWGFLKDDDRQEGPFWDRFRTWSDRVPLLGRIELPIARLMVLVALGAMAILVPLVLLAAPTVSDRLSGEVWCLERVIHDGVEREPYVPGFSFTLSDCPYPVHFENDGTVELPGFGTYSLSGRWVIEGGYLWLEGVVAEEPIYQGPFEVKVTDRELLLRSERTQVLCSRWDLLPW
ncbi:MAG: DUF2007 domain-containing protein [Flavobacteriales bacterium]|nr:DUF2007 domain-containing protein [Flavobacteriales bacterium]